MPTFWGEPRAVIAVGHAIGAFHVAGFLAHKEFQETGIEIAAAVLILGIFAPSPEAPEVEKAYFGPDASAYENRSALPGIGALEIPLAPAWSAADAPRRIAETDKFRQYLRAVGHCPRLAQLRIRCHLLPHSILLDPATFSPSASVSY